MSFIFSACTYKLKCKIILKSVTFCTNQIFKKEMSRMQFLLQLSQKIVYCESQCIIIMSLCGLWVPQLRLNCLNYLSGSSLSAIVDVCLVFFRSLSMFIFRHLNKRCLHLEGVIPRSCNVAYVFVALNLTKPC